MRKHLLRYKRPTVLGGSSSMSMIIDASNDTAGSCPLHSNCTLQGGEGKVDSRSALVQQMVRHLYPLAVSRVELLQQVGELGDEAAELVVLLVVLPVLQVVLAQYLRQSSACRLLSLIIA